MSKENRDVYRFHKKFGIPQPSTPHFLSRETLKFRAEFLTEELTEFIRASGMGCEFTILKGNGAPPNMHDMADALVDLVYVAHGTALMMGFPWDQLWDEVQKKNMMKERATSADQSKRGSSLDVIKPPGWTPPDHTVALGKGPWPTIPEA